MACWCDECDPLSARRELLTQAVTDAAVNPVKPLEQVCWEEREGGRQGLQRVQLRSCNVGLWNGLGGVPSCVILRRMP